MKGAISSSLCWLLVVSTLSICDVMSSPADGQVTGSWELVRPALRMVGRESQDSAQHFGVVAGAFIGSDSTLAVGDGTTGTIRFFDARGRLVRTVGRLGSGPGEFRELSWIGACNHRSFAAYDASQLRLTRFDSVARPAGIRNSPLGFVILRPLACMTDGAVIGVFDSRTSLPARSGIVRTDAVLVRVAPDFASADTLAVFPGTERYFANEEGGYGELPLGRTAIVAASAQFAAVGQNDSSWISVHRIGIRPARRVTLSLKPHTLTREDFAHAVQMRIREEPRPETREILTRVFKRAPPPTGVRYFRQLAVDALDHIWVESFEAAPDQRSVWFVFDQSGRRVGQVLLPKDSRVLYASGDRVLLLARSDDGTESVELFRIRK